MTTFKDKHDEIRKRFMQGGKEWEGRGLHVAFYAGGTAYARMWKDDGGSDLAVIGLLASRVGEFINGAKIRRVPHFEPASPVDTGWAEILASVKGVADNEQQCLMGMAWYTGAVSMSGVIADAQAAGTTADVLNVIADATLDGLRVAYEMAHGEK